MYANQGCLCPTQGAAAAQDDFLLTAASATYSICMDSSVITGVERCCCQRFVNVRTSKQSSTRWCISVCVLLLLCVCVAAANLKLKQLLFGLRRRRIYISRYIYLYAFFIHASLPCYITILLVYLSCMLVQKNVLLLLMNALSLIISVEGGTGL